MNGKHQQECGVWPRAIALPAIRWLWLLEPRPQVSLSLSLSLLRAFLTFFRLLLPLFCILS